MKVNNNTTTNVTKSNILAGVWTQKYSLKHMQVCRQGRHTGKWAVRQVLIGNQAGTHANRQTSRQAAGDRRTHPVHIFHCPNSHWDRCCWQQEAELEYRLCQVSSRWCQIAQWPGTVVWCFLWPPAPSCCLLSAVDDKVETEKLAPKAVCNWWDQTTNILLWIAE